MAKRKPRVQGPYRHGAGYRCSFRRAGKTCATEIVPTLEEAVRLKYALQRELDELHGITVGEALAEYEAHMVRKGNKPTSIYVCKRRLRDFFPDLTLSLAGITPKEGERLYDALATRTRKSTGTKLAADTHRNTLADAKTFFLWCIRKGWIRSSPLSLVEGQGRRRRGKAQLGIDEARKLAGVTLRAAERGDVGAVAVLVSLYLGLRSGEIVNLRVRDVDDGGRVLWIREALDATLDQLKTRAAHRAPRVPELLRPLLVGLGQGRAGTEYLFGQHWRDWPRKQTARFCKAAGVPRVCAHGLRGLRSTLALISGENPEIVARTLGHTSSRVTLSNYAAPGTREELQQRRIEEALTPRPADPPVSDEKERPTDGPR